MDQLCRKLFFPFFFLSFFWSLSAQDYVVNLQQYGIEDGLSHREVKAIVKDKRGFIWCGTPYGLNRFDGYQFKTWTQEKDGLPNNNIDDLNIDADGNLWIMFSVLQQKYDFIKNIVILDPVSEELKTFEEKFGKDLDIPLQKLNRRLVQDREAVFYFGSNSGPGTQAHMVSYHPRVGFRYFPLKSFSSFLPVGITTRQTIWGIADTNYLIEISREGKILQIHSQEETLPWRKVVVKGNEVIFELRRKNKKSDLFIIDTHGKQKLFSNNFHALNTNRFDDIFKQLKYNPFQKHLWVMDKGYLPIFDHNNQTILNLYDPFPYLKNDRGFGWLDVFFEESGITWIGGNYGLYQIEIKPNKFSRYLFKENWNSNKPFQIANPTDNMSCRGIFATKEKLFVNTERNLLQIIDLQKHTTSPNQSTESIDIQLLPDMKRAFGLIQSKDHQIWIGQDGLQTFNYEQKKLETIQRSKEATSLETIWAIYEGQDSILWLGGMHGLQTLDRKERQIKIFEGYNDFQELAQSHIIYINKDNNGLIWICSNSGLYTLDVDKGITAHFGSNEKGVNFLPHNNFHHFYQDESGIYWLGTAGGGLIRWDKKDNTFQQFTKIDGLSNNVIYAIYEDQHQHLWMSSDYGIIQFDKKTFQSKAYLIEDGISYSEFNRTSHFKTPDGRIYFGSLNGVTAFHPNDFYDFEKSTPNATVQITTFQQFDDASNRLKDKTAELIETNKITLNNDDPFFRLGFSLLTYEPSEKIQYAYKIEGVYKDWTYQKEAFIQMGRLPYGNHVLKIKGQGANGQWSSEELAINIHALRPVYLQNWFIIIVGLSLLTLILGGIKWRTLQYKKNQKKLELEVANQTSMIQQQADELKELDASKNRFYNNISHEFRTPITVIMGMVDNIKGHENERTLVRRNSKNLLRLVNQLLDLSKVESGSMEINLVKGDIINYLQYLTESFDSAAKEKNIQLFFYGEQRTLYIAFDEVKVQQIVYNLLSNAIKFTGQYGKVVLHATQVEKENHAYLQLKITDNGIGITSEELPHIFDRFYQTDSSTTRKGEGTGIGLALTKELIELMEGFIFVKSTLGQGTEFTILFPIKEAVQTLPNPSYLSAGKITSEKINPPTSIESIDTEQNEVFQENGLPQILIIEDNLDVIFYLESILKKEYQIIKAQDGSKGINKAFKFIPDLIITDVMMPEKDGFEVCNTLKTDQRTSHIPIVILTAKATDVDRIIGLENGADAFLMKPFNKKELFIRLEKLINLRKALQKRYGHSNYYLQSIEKEKKAIVSQSIEDLFLQKLHTAVLNNIENTNFDVNQLSQSVHLSQSQLYRKLKALTGETPNQLIRKIRLHKGLELLKTTDLNIAEVAYSVGFSDPNYFSRMFHKEFGKSPRLLRK